jgi:ribonucleoside-diphosphate reductase alpha chain
MEKIALTIPTDYQSFIHQSRYSRWLDSEGRRETWEETVTRLLNFYTVFLEREHSYALPKALYTDLYVAIVSMGVMPSMRAMMTAGPALERNHIAAYNCSYLPVDSPRSFDECLFILLHGTGVGFSVERQYINQLPPVPDTMESTETTIIVQDSKEGWFKAFKELINLLYAGMLPNWDLSRIRSAGTKLKTFGGRASGPAPLDKLFRFAADMFKGAAGRRLTSMECHDLMCQIAAAVIVGGVRRSALISLSNLGDDRLRHAKTGDWYVTDTQRSYANNSVCYTSGMDMGAFLREWSSLYDSKSGERGIFNRIAAQKQAAKYGRRDADVDYGTNPCSEIILRPKQFCNLSEVVVRQDDTVKTLKDKIEFATILGTIQSCFTDFKGLGRQWVRNTEEERLLGVSLTGILDNPMLANLTDDDLPSVLNELREHAVSVNKKYSSLIGINPSAAITCVKPSGTVSQLVDAASGIHPRHSEYYIRTVRADKKDPLTLFMAMSGVPVEDEMNNPDTTAVFSFPIKAPVGSITRNNLTAVEHMELWKIYADSWCEHKPSITVSVREEEWLEVGSFVYKNFDTMSGVSFLPMSDHIYAQAPYTDCTEREYNALLDKMPKDIDWSKLSEYETDDTTHGSQTLNCTGDYCEVVDIV